MTNKFNALFGQKPLIGMIHLASSSSQSKIHRALEELMIYAEEGVRGAIIENYHGSEGDVIAVLDEIARAEDVKAQISDLRIGINILPNEFELALRLASQHGHFIQLDYGAGRYDNGGPTIELPVEEYSIARKKYHRPLVMVGVHPKYYDPVSNLHEDLQTAMTRADAIVVTGSGTGKETPLEKIQEFRQVIGNFPLIVGAGITPRNAYHQLTIADGAIIGSAFKPGGNTQQAVDRELVRELVEIADSIRYANDQ